MKNNIVSVLLWGKEICKLKWEGGYRQKFGKVGSLISFNPEYHSFGFDVDPVGFYNHSTYLVQKGMSDICHANEYNGIPRFLSSSLPDDWGNEVFSLWIEKNGLRSHDLTPVDKLAFIGRRGMGAFEFVPQLYDPRSDEAIALEDLYGLAKEIESMREGVSINIQDRPEINDLMAVGMSAGGKHPKAIVAINWSTGEVRSGQFILPNDFTQYILKFKDSDKWPTAEIEYAYYLMAKDASIDMEKCSLLEIDGENHFLTERFDRKEGRKLHSVTLQSLCGTVTSYEEIFKVCRKLQLPYHDIEQIFRRAVFNYLSGVCDDHDKNFSFVMDEDGRWRLSPAYDETFTVNFKNRFIGDKHIMTIEECNRDISMNQFVRLADENDVRNAEHIVKEISEVVQSFTDKAIDVKINTIYTELISQFIKSKTDLLH
ncbi:type II toxin-antitoxin system HipA family toxin [Parabacteroides faecis]|uniref:Serine/threonine-protein kinase HipA n=1 Tax=Parabacteroides faecis TaxID=1217282 RepID=A0ABR6KJE7_9BACT|nr:type II toxin-antitoxin system HipA family toxin [Parabacteroides faecis]MBB4621042.1 serine/threonine-protein kinase HipA [Parabacteroides faecis]GGJ89596.1 toxin HipA [Parabacteroides faecis]